MRGWPDVLPPSSWPEYLLTPVDQTIRTDMEVGDEKVRRTTFANRDTVDVSWRVTDAEFEAYRAWFGDAAWSLAGDSDDLSLWSLSNVTRTLDAAIGPDGVLADRIAETTATGGHRAEIALGSSILAGDDITLQATMKSNGPTWVRLVLVDLAGGTTFANLNLLTGAIGTTSGTLATPEVKDRGNGWWRVKFKADVASGAGPALLRVNMLDETPTVSYTGIITRTVDICEVSARVPTGSDLFVRTGADGKALGAAGGAGWFLVPLAFGGGMKTVEARFLGTPGAKPQQGLNWIISGKLRVRNA